MKCSAARRSAGDFADPITMTTKIRAQPDGRGMTTSAARLQRSARLRRAGHQPRSSKSPFCTGGLVSGFPSIRTPDATKDYRRR